VSVLCHIGICHDLFFLLGRAVDQAVSRRPLPPLPPFWSQVKSCWICGRQCDSARFEVFTVVTMKNGVFWDVTPCDSCKIRRFGGT
jgi:hypothetical protein